MIHQTRSHSTAPWSSFKVSSSFINDPVLSSPVLWTPLVGTEHCTAATPHITCCSGPSHPTVTIWPITVTHILTLVHFSCFHHINFQTWLFTCCLIYPTQIINIMMFECCGCSVCSFTASFRHKSIYSFSIIKEQILLNDSFQYHHIILKLWFTVSGFINYYMSYLSPLLM